MLDGSDYDATGAGGGESSDGEALPDEEACERARVFRFALGLGDFGGYSGFEAGSGFGLGVEGESGVDEDFVARADFKRRRSWRRGA